MSTPARATAILLTSRLIYKECIPILYSHTTVEIALRCEEDSKVPRGCMNDLGLIENCKLMSRLRHIELEISFNAYNYVWISRAAKRVRKLASELNVHGKLKTLDLVFFQVGRHYLDEGTPGDELVKEANTLTCEKLLGVSRNIAATHAISSSKWAGLRRLVFNVNEEESEQFQEISLDYWERAFANREYDNRPA